MIYLIERNGNFYFNRRVPEAYRNFDRRGVIRYALKTRDRRVALRLSMATNAELETYWSTLSTSGQEHSPENYKSIVARAKTLGFNYYPAQDVAQLPLQQLIERLLLIEKGNFNEAQVEAVCGKLDSLSIRIEEALERYFDLTKDKLLNKSPNQIRKWGNPRKKAISNLVKVIGNKPIHEFNRNDALKFRDWWIERVKTESLISSSANKDLIYVKTIISEVAEDLKIDLDTVHAFKNLLLKEDDNETRMPFDSGFIVSTLLDPEKLKGLNEQARWVLHGRGPE